MSTLVTIIGFGKVGRAVAFLLSASRVALTVNIVDPEVGRGAFLDISHAYQGGGHTLCPNQHDLTPRSEVIFHCAGPSVPPGATRLSVAEESLALTEKIFFGIEFEEQEPLVVVLANPVDLVCLRAWQASGLPPERIIGTGTLLDTRRFNVLLEERLGLEVGASQAMVLGEHGSSMALWTAGSRLEGRPILEKVSPKILAEVMVRTKESAAEIKRHQGATYYGVAHCAVSLWHLHRERNQVLLPASVLIRESFETKWGNEPYFMSVPVLLGQHAVEMPGTTFKDKDLIGLTASANALHDAWP